MRTLAHILVLAVGLILAFAGPAGAANPSAAQFEKAISADERALTAARDAVAGGAGVEVRALEARLRELRRAARARRGPIEAELRLARDELDRLGPAPAADALPEDAAVARQRKDSAAEVARLQGLLTRTTATFDGAGALLGEISRRRLALLYSSLGERGEPLLSPRLWGAAAGDAVAASGQMVSHFQAWVSGPRRRGSAGLALDLAIVLAAIVLAVMMIGPAHRTAIRALLRRAGRRADPDQRRGEVRMLASLVPGLFGGCVVIGAALVTGLLPQDQFGLARSGLFALAAGILGHGLVRARNPIGGIVFAAMVTYGLQLVLVSAAEAGDIGEDLRRLSGLVAAALVGALLIALGFVGRGMARAGAQPGGAGSLRAAMTANDIALRRAGPWIGAGLLISALAGYFNLAEFLASRIYFLTAIALFAWSLRGTLRAASGAVLKRWRGASTAAESDVARFWAGLAIDGALICALAPFILILAGLSPERVRDVAAQAFFGFKVAGATISLARIALALGLFLLGLALTRLLQRALKRGPFAHSRLDPGVQESLTTLVGYVGLALAAVIGVTGLGFNLSNLAIIAGALSVGVGFGLQSIVNNFVSGLILLFERPIKVGDWVVTQSGEGIIRKISVRSTEIETFERSSIIVPNSELISQTVTNWTHKNRIGRISVPVGVAYDSDPEEVRAILLKCANDHPEIVRFPEPFVVWRDFGASALEFELRAFLGDIAKGLQTRTDLRFAIFKAFNEAGIRIPFPQHDVYIRSAPEASPPRKGEGGGRAARAPAHEQEDAGAMAPDD